MAALQPTRKPLTDRLHLVDPERPNHTVCGHWWSCNDHCSPASRCDWNEEKHERCPDCHRWDPYLPRRVEVSDPTGVAELDELLSPRVRQEIERRLQNLEPAGEVVRIGEGRDSLAAQARLFSEELDAAEAKVLSAWDSIVCEWAAGEIRKRRSREAIWRTLAVPAGALREAEAQGGLPSPDPDRLKELLPEALAADEQDDEKTLRDRVGECAMGYLRELRA